MIIYNKEVPILFLIFNRPDTTSKVFETIKRAAPKRLYVAADGPRYAEESLKCYQSREIATAADWNCEVKTLFREENVGCKAAISEGISWFFENEPEGIVLEDDCLPSDSFFGFCSFLLEKYRNDDRIGHIGGANLQLGQKRGDDTYYFSRQTHVWGWAGWRRVWKDYDVNMQDFPQFKSNRLIRFLPTHRHFSEYWLNSFEKTYRGTIDTWDYQYAYLNLKNNRLSVIPNTNLISNIGFGSDSTHTNQVNHPFANLQPQNITSITHPIFFLPNEEADFFTQQIEHPNPKPKGFLSLTWRKIKQKFKRKPH